MTKKSKPVFAPDSKEWSGPPSAPYARASSYKGFSLAQLHAFGITKIDEHQIPAAVLGQAAYEADVLKQPTYHDGKPRPTWEQLDEISRDSWVRNPTSRDKEG